MRLFDLNPTYLDITLTELLDYDIIAAELIAQSASRTFGLLIAKYKNMDGIPFYVFTKLFDSAVWPIISYGAAIWGSKPFMCINAVQNRAMRFFRRYRQIYSDGSGVGEMA